MDFTLTEEQMQIKALVKEFCEREVDIKRVAEIEDKAAKVKTVEELRSFQPVSLIKKLHDVGLRQLAVPAKYGGGGANHMTLTVVGEQAGYSGTMMAILYIPWIVCYSLAHGLATEEQRDWFFTQFMENPTLDVAGTISEPSGGVDQHLPYDEPGVGMQTFAYKDGDEWVINGDKMFSSGAGTADLIQVAARTDKNGPVSQSFSWFWVRKDTPGVTISINRMIAANVAGGNVQVCYENVRVPESHLIGEVNKGYLSLGNTLAVKMCGYASMFGETQRLYEHMRDYAKQRVQGGKPIIQHSSIASMLGELAMNIEATRAFLYRAAWENDQRQKAGAPVNLFWGQAGTCLCKKMAWRLCEIAPRIYGGIAGSVDLPFESFVRRTFLLQAGSMPINMNEIKCSMEYDELGDTKASATQAASVA